MSLSKTSYHMYHELPHDMIAVRVHNHIMLKLETSTVRQCYSWLSDDDKPVQEVCRDRFQAFQEAFQACALISFL